MEKEEINLIAGKRYGSNAVHYWQTEVTPNVFKIGNYAIVEGDVGFDLVEIVGILITTKEHVENFGRVKKMKMLINKNDLIESGDSNELRY